jgi:hypothetical protein
VVGVCHIKWNVWEMCENWEMWIMTKKIHFHHMFCILCRFIMYVYNSYRNEFTEFVRRLESTDMDEEFTEFVRLSKNWKDLARHCGYELKFGAGANHWRAALQKKVASLGLDTQHFNCRPRMDQMYHISVPEFKEHVRLSDNWSELARRCGWMGKKTGCRVVNLLREKVLFLKLDTQHFTKCAKAGADGGKSVENA